MIALIDGDLCAFRSAASIKEGEDLEIAVLRADKLLRQILEEVNATEYKLFLSGTENFRKIINKEYKANRTAEPPQYLQDVREFLVTEWNAKLSSGQEADDELGINQTKDTIICSLDKDLKMIPGWHYGWEFGTATWTKPAERVYMDEEQASKHFWKQLLIGDKADNIFGVDGLGPVKSGKLIDPQSSDQECLEVVLEKYNNDYKRFAMNAACLWIKRHKDSEWQIDLHLTLNDELQHEVDQITSCMKSLMEGI